MAKEQRAVVFTLPPFGPWSKRLAIVAGALWLVHLVLWFVARPGAIELLPTIRWGALIPAKVTSDFQVWRVLTYACLDAPTSFDGLWSVITLWLMGSQIEQREGVRGIVIPWIVGALGGAAALLALSGVASDYKFGLAMGLSPILFNALIVKWGFLYARERVSFFGLAEMDGRVLAGVFAAIGAINALTSRTPTAMASLGAMIVVFGWVGAMQRRGGGGGGTRKRGGSGTFKVIQGGKKDEKKWVN
jgi:membrane associated rhomboid family serine protease